MEAHYCPIDLRPPPLSRHRRIHKTKTHRYQRQGYTRRLSWTIALSTRFLPLKWCHRLRHHCGWSCHGRLTGRVRKPVMRNTDTHQVAGAFLWKATHSHWASLCTKVLHKKSSTVTYILVLDIPYRQMQSFTFDEFENQAIWLSIIWFEHAKLAVMVGIILFECIRF